MIEDRYCKITLLFTSEKDLFQFMGITKSPAFEIKKFLFEINGLFTPGDINAAKMKFHASVLEEKVLF